MAGNEKPYPARVVLSHELQTSGSGVMRWDNHVLEKIAETGLDCPLIPVDDVQIVRDRAHL
jgi:hypothetical protein